MAEVADRPAFYALSPGGWPDLVTILHPPYTAWHLSYVALGAAVAPAFHAVRLWAALGAFFLGVGVAAHALDELHGHPLGTGLSNRTLGVLAYNLELFGGRFHTDFWFAAAWGAFPALTGFWVMALGIHSIGEAVAGAGVTAACFGLSVAQRRLSTPVRELRRKTVSVSGTQVLTDGTERELTSERLAAPLDGALKVLSASVALLAV